MRRFTLLVFLIIGACSNNTEQEKTDRNLTTIILNEDESVKTVIEFIKWYRDNLYRLNNIELIKNAYSDSPDSTKVYSVNLDSVEQYLMEINKCDHVSDKYITQLRKYFENGNKYLFDNPQFEGPPEGFEFDLVLWSQDYREDLDNIDKINFYLVKNDYHKKEIKVNFFGGAMLRFALSKQNNKWLIDQITRDNIK